MDMRRDAAGVGGRAPSAEARGREVERAPEELHRARLAEEARAEALEDHVSAQQRGRETADRFAVVRANLDVVAEGDRRGDLARHAVDMRGRHANVREP